MKEEVPEEVIEAAQEVWPEAEGFELAPGGWTFRIGAGYAWITYSLHVSDDPEGLRDNARRALARCAGRVPVAPIPDTQCWVYRADREGTDPERTQMSFGNREGAHVPEVLAADVARQTRIGHSYTGPLTVWVWQAGGDEHYRKPVPEHAHRYDYAPGHPTDDTTTPGQEA